MADLTDRQEKILTFVVKEYIETAIPVGSETLRRRGLSVSSATIRNELAELEEEGYLTHPHTSAGRVPTERGYRYFVESLMEEFELPIVEQRMISHQFHQVTLDVDQWMRLTAAVLSRAAHGAALVTAPLSTRCRFKHLQLITIGDQVALLVLVLQEGTVKQQMLALARIFRTGAKLLLLDEISEGLAPVIVQSLSIAVSRLRDLGFTVLLVEQNFRFTEKLADKFYVLEEGRVITEFERSALPSMRSEVACLLGV